MAELARMSIAHDTTLEWLALSLTPGLGPTRSRRLVDLLGGIEGVFRASLTELEATGIPAVAAQSLGTGRSLELANDEQAKAAAAGVQLQVTGVVGGGHKARAQDPGKGEQVKRGTVVTVFF